MTKTLGILTGGGDVPGLNPCIKAVVMNALEQGYRVIGIRRGWAGLLHYNQNEPSTREYYVRELHEEDVRTIDRTGGTVLHTSRTNPQRVSPKDAPDFLKNSSYGKKVNGEEKIDYTDYVLEVLGNLGIDVLVPIGGDDTLSFAVRLHKEGFPIVACPKTMDNDIFGTDYCIGFSTAVTRSVEFITNMRTSNGQKRFLPLHLLLTLWVKGRVNLPPKDIPSSDPRVSTPIDLLRNFGEIVDRFPPEKQIIRSRYPPLHQPSQFHTAVDPQHPIRFLL